MKKTALILILTLASVSVSSLSWSDNSGFSGKGLTSLLSSMVNGDIQFPKRFNTSAQSPLTDPDISMFVNKKHLSSLLTAYMKKPIILGDDPSQPSSTLKADKVTIKPDPKRNVLQVFIKGGVLNLKQAYAGMEGKLLITNAEFEILPHIAKNPKNQVLLEARIRLVHLDIDKTEPVIDKGIASLLQDLYFNEQPLEAFNLSDYVNNLEGPAHIDLRLDRAVVLMKDNGIDIQTTWIAGSR